MTTADAKDLGTSFVELRQKLRMIISHASGGHLSEPTDIDRSTNDICVEISRHHNRVWECAKESALEASPRSLTEAITPAMIDAGRDAWVAWQDSRGPCTLSEAIYTAMQDARPIAPETMALNMRLLLDTAIKHKLETQTHGGLTEFGKGGLAALEALEREFDHLRTTPIAPVQDDDALRETVANQIALVAAPETPWCDVLEAADNIILAKRLSKLSLGDTSK